MLQKKKLKKKLRNNFFDCFLFLFFLLVSLSTQAAYIEPYLGQVRYQQVQSVTNSAGSNVSVIRDKGQRFGIGLRYGPHFGPVFLGIDFSYFPLKRVDTLSGATNNTFLFFGPTLGMQIPFLPLRVWSSFSYLDRVRNNGAAYSGKSFKFGAGFLFSAHVSFNIEFGKHVYSRYEKEGTVWQYPLSQAGLYLQRPEMKTIFLSLSFPFYNF